MYSSGTITWNGTSSSTHGVVITRPSGLARPERKIDRYSVPGKNGDIIIPQDAWENYSQEYEIAMGSGSGLTSKVKDIAEWLYGASGYAVLQDSFEPNLYRQAYFAGPYEIESLLAKYGRAKIRFNCRPERFLTSGADFTEYTSKPATITNPTNWPAKPLLRVYGTGGTVTIADVNIAISSINEYINLDFETQNAYKGSVNLNNRITITTGVYPTLASGANTLSWDSGITSVKVMPRWWTI